MVPRELLPVVASEDKGPDRLSWVSNSKGCIPTLHQWEAARRKHPGPDGIKAELIKLDVPTIAKASFSLVVKMALCCQEPLRFRGGLLAALYKGRGAHRDCNNSRSILLANTLGKCYHSCLRAEVVPYAAQHMLPSQAGAVAGRTLEAVAMATRAPLEHASFKRRSAAILYVDIKAAFYSVFRPLLTGNDMSDDYLAYACRYLSLPPIFVEFLRDTVEGATTCVCTETNVPDDLRRQLAACLHHSWNATTNSQGLAYAWAGTRPGDPLGDVLFVMLCSQVLKDVRGRIAEQGLGTGGMESQASLDPCLASPAWVDDVAFFQWASTPQDLLNRIARLSSIVHNAFGIKGLCLNNKPGKSSVMPVLRGPHAREVRKKLEASWEAGLPYSTLAGIQAMPLVKSYKHLGAIMDYTATLEPEIHARIVAARQEVRALTKHVFGNSRIQLAQRLHYFSSIVLSKISFMAGTWRELRAGESKAWRYGVLSLYRCLLPVRQRYEAATWSAETLCGQLRVPHPDTIITLARARVFLALQQGEDECVKHVLAEGSGELSWTAAVVRDSQWVSQILCENHDWFPRQQFSWSCSGMAYLKAVQKAIDAHCLRMVARSASCREPLVEVQEPPAPVLQATLQCPLCDACFSTKKQISAHANKVHGIGSVARYYAPRSHTCYACRQRFATRQKLVSHLSIWSHACLDELKASFQPIPTAEVAELDKQARARHNSFGHQGRFSDDCRALPMIVELQSELELVGNSAPRPVPVLCSEDLPGCSQLMSGPRTTFLERPT